MASKELILTTIISVFILLGFFLPFVSSAFEQQVPENSISKIEADVGQDDLSTLEIIGSIFKMFFWTFGDLPAWLDTIFLIPRLMLAVIIFQIIRGS
jgi:hypothetical protein